jgi:hypothetical protein
MGRNKRRRKGFAKVMRMPDEYADSSGTTDQFRAFVQSDAPAVPARSRTPLIIGVAAAVLVVAVVIILVAVS